MMASPRIDSQRRLVLASSSPRRKDILSGVFSEFVIDPPKKPEKPIAPGVDPDVSVLALAREKAEEVAQRHPDSIVIGCDTCVWTNHVLGKPQDRADAQQMLQELSGRKHTVISGLWVIDTKDQRSLYAVERTDVYFDELSPEDVNYLLDSGEYEGKAGAYAIQGLTGLFIRGIEGDYNNVVGLPMRTLYRILREFGICVP